jgi:hypothetical protein
MCRRFFEKKRRKGTMGQIKLNNAPMAFDPFNGKGNA